MNRMQYGNVLNSLLYIFPQDDQKKNDCKNLEFPFEADADDHCESPLQAYQDVLPFLQDFQKKQSSSGDIFIYDPYFCNGAVKHNLRSLGFSNVYNTKEGRLTFVHCHAQRSKYLTNSWNWKPSSSCKIATRSGEHLPIPPMTFSSQTLLIVGTILRD